MQIYSQRRSSAARVRHGKRRTALDVNNIPGPVTITFTQTIAPASTTNIHIPPTSIIVSPPSTGPLAVSTSSTLPLPSDSLSSAFLTQSFPSSSPLSTSTDSDPPKPSASVSTSSGVNGASQVTTSGPAIPAGGIVGIVLGVVVVFLIGIVIAIRRQSLNKRLKLRGWTANRNNPPSFLWIESGEKSKISPFPRSPQVPNRRDIPPAAGGTAGTQYNSSSAARVPPLPVPTFLSQPDYNADLPPIPVVPNQVSETAVVVSTFIPALPDELSIATKETLRILSVYDDGWAYCANERGEAGMVPMECLARRGIARSMGRRSRGSSLAPSQIQVVPRF